MADRSMLAAPKCLAEGCTRPVKQKHSGNRYKGGERIIDGVQWRMFCRHACAARTAGLANVGTSNFQVAARARRQQRFERDVQRVMAACRDVVDAEGRVSVRDAVKIIMRENDRNYRRGWSTAMHRTRRLGLNRMREAA